MEKIIKHVSSFQFPSCKILNFFFVATFLVFTSATTSVDPTPTGDQTALLHFKSWLDDPNRYLSTWLNSTNCNTWTGVACDSRAGYVTSLNVTCMHLSGFIHPSLCSLTQLKALDLSRNEFNGSIPSCFGNFRVLETLDLSHNRFSGDIPNTFTDMVMLKELVLRDNLNISGLLPVWIGNISDKLEKIDLGFNSFRGQIPESLFGSKSITYIDLENNYLSGHVREFDHPLVYLNLGSNLIYGTLPCFNASTRSLSILNLASNLIVGAIPTCLSSLRELRVLNLSMNQLNYDISPRFIFSEKLTVLDLSYNEFSGPLPVKITEMVQKSGLVVLDLSHNKFVGEIPKQYTELQSLQALAISYNLLTGEIPVRIGNLTYLQVIDLSHNFLSGSIPLNIIGCFQLLALILNNNNLSGEIQPELDALSSLKILDISNNKISGEIPLTLAGCKSLEVVDLSSNNLSGLLSDAITRWDNLRILSLARNKFDGGLPSWIFTFESLQTIDLSSNKFSGFIPEGNYNVSLCFTKGRNKSINFSTATKQKPLTKLVAIVLDGIDLSFPLDLSSRIGIDLSDNLLHGEIPHGLFGFPGLEYLNLSCNFLDGQVQSFEKMQSLRTLDLSHNLLSGRIPENISALLDLKLLNLSYNGFSGVVSNTQEYLRFPGAFAGNPGLCVEVSTGGCEAANLPIVPGKRFEAEVDDSGPISVPKHMKAPVFVYYQLDNFYQNHRSYVKSRSDKQLRSTTGVRDTDSCKPEANVGGDPIVPCGLIAWSLFSDIYAFSINQTRVEVNRKNIAWKSDRTHKFGSNVYPQNFQTQGPKHEIGGGKLNSTIALSEQEDLNLVLNYINI